MQRAFLILLMTVGVLSGRVYAETGYIIDSDGTNHLWSLDLDTGVASDIGAVNYPQIEGLAAAPNGVIFGVDDVTDTLVTLDTATGVATAVGSGDGNLGVDVADVGLTFDGTGNLWLSSEVGNAFYAVNPATGQATLISDTQSPEITGLAACGTTIFGLVDGPTPQLATINPATGAVTVIGPLGGGIAVNDDGGLAMGASRVLWGIADVGAGTSPLFTINMTTGAAAFVANVTDGAIDVVGIEGFTTATSPAAVCGRAAPAPTLSHWGLALQVLLLAAIPFWTLRRRRSTATDPSVR